MSPVPAAPDSPSLALLRRFFVEGVGPESRNRSFHRYEDRDYRCAALRFRALRQILDEAAGADPARLEVRRGVRGGAPAMRLCYERQNLRRTAFFTLEEWRLLWEVGALQRALDVQKIPVEHLHSER